MSTNALAFILLYKHRTGATIEELVESLDDLRRELANSDRDIGFTGDSIDVINYAVSYHLVDCYLFTNDTLKIFRLKC